MQPSRRWLAIVFGSVCLAGVQPQPQHLPPPLQPLPPPPPPRRHSVSGFSSGADMAIIHQIAFSSRVSGMAIVGGAPYGCQILPDSGNTCGTCNSSLPWPRFNSQVAAYLANRSAAGVIDDLSNMLNKPIFLWSGLRDSVVYQEVMRAVEVQFTNLEANVTSRFDVASEHAWIADNHTCAHPGVPGGSKQKNAQLCCAPKEPTIGHCTLPPASGMVPVGSGCCGVCSSGPGRPGSPRLPSNDTGPWWLPPINNCGFDMSGYALALLLHPRALHPRVLPVQANMLMFQQQPYVEAAGGTLSSACMEESGLVYTPTSCRASAAALAGCTVHIHYHPCGGNWRQVGYTYFLANGLAAWAEANAIVLLFPQASDAGVDGGGCWDWYGATGSNFDTHSGLQLNAVLQMAERLASIVSPPDPF